MHLSRREFLDDFVTFVGEESDADARNVAERLLNQTLTKLWLRRAWAMYRSPVPLQITLAVNQRRYALPDYFGRVGPGEVKNATRSGTPIHPLRPGDLEQRYPLAGTAFEVADLPSAYEITGLTGVHTQPNVVGEALEAVSDHASDTDVRVVVTGDDVTGRWTRVQATLTGTSAVALGTWSYIDEFGKSYTAGVTPATELTSSRGSVTLQTVSTPVELQKLFAYESAKEHPVLTIFPKPSAADVITMPLIRKMKRLLYDADPLPDLWEPMIHEEMIYQWKVNTGELSPIAAASAPRPCFIDLLAHEQASLPRPRSRGYRGI